MRLLFAGTPEVALPALDALLDSPHEVIAVLTRPDALTGRGRRLAASPVAMRARELGIEVLTPARPRDPEFLARLGDLAPDCAPIVAYGGLIPKAALDIPRLGWVNLHFSLLPAWRGAAPVQHAILHGDDVTGACTFALEEGLDTGPVYGVVTEPIGPRDTSGDLLSRLSTSGAQLLRATIDGLDSGAIHAEPQPADGISLAPKISVEDARVRWDDPAIAVDRRVRAGTPAPGAWTIFRGERLGIGAVTLIAGPTAEAGPAETGLAESAPTEPGRLVAGKKQVLVATASGWVELGTVTPAGKRPMPAADWARGVRVAPAERLG